MADEPDVLGIAAFFPLIRRTRAFRAWLLREELRRAGREFRRFGRLLLGALVGTGT